MILNFALFLRVHLWISIGSLFVLHARAYGQLIPTEIFSVLFFIVLHFKELVLLACTTCSIPGWPVLFESDSLQLSFVTERVVFAQTLLTLHRRGISCLKDGKRVKNLQHRRINANQGILWRIVLDLQKLKFYGTFGLKMAKSINESVDLASLDPNEYDILETREKEFAK